MCYSLSSYICHNPNLMCIIFRVWGVTTQTRTGRKNVSSITFDHEDRHTQSHTYCTKTPERHQHPKILHTQGTKGLKSCDKKPHTQKKNLLATTFDSLSEPTGCCHKSDDLCAVAQDITTCISATLLLKDTK